MIKKLFSFLKYRTMFIYTILYTGLLIKNSILSSPNVFFLKSGETIKVPTHFQSWVQKQVTIRFTHSFWSQIEVFRRVNIHKPSKPRLHRSYTGRIGIIRSKIIQQGLIITPASKGNNITQARNKCQQNVKGKYAL